jgi:hypothetical protein
MPQLFFQINKNDVKIVEGELFSLAGISFLDKAHAS